MAILVVESQSLERDSICNALSDAGQEVATAESYARALELLQGHPYSLAIVSLELCGVEEMRDLRGRFPWQKLAVVLAASTPLSSRLLDVLECGANDFLVYPIHAESLLNQLQFQIDRLKASQESLDLEEILPEMARHSQAGVGDSVSHYKLLAPLGEGFWGQVFRALDKQLLREVAIKVLKPTDQLLQGDATRLLSEARMVAQLEHPGVVRVYEVGFKPCRYIVMELVSGQLLFDYVESDLPLAQVRDWTVELLEALAAVHEKGIVHRDVKPNNVMVTREGRLKLMDFGLAGRPESHSGSGGIYGTPVYASPEHFDWTLGSVSVRSDLFSVAIVLYELLTSFLPFNGQSLSELAYAILKQTPDAPHAVKPAIPLDLSKICLKGLAKRPEDRFPDALSFARALQKVRL